MESKRLGHNIGFYRRQRGLTAEELAKAVGRSPNRIRQIEGGVGFPTLELLDDISKALDTNISYLLKDDSTIACQYAFFALLEQNDFTKEQLKTINNVMNALLTSYQ